MATVTVNDQSLSAIADAIRGKLDVETTYLPSQMAAAIESIETGIELSSADEGKVVVESSGEYVLTAQTSRSISENGTYDTTTNDEVTVNVSGGSSSGTSLFCLQAGYIGSYEGSNSSGDIVSRTVAPPSSGQKILLIVMHRVAVTVSDSLGTTITLLSTVARGGQSISIYECTPSAATTFTISRNGGGTARVCGCMYYISAGVALSDEPDNIVQLNQSSDSYRYDIPAQDVPHLVVISNVYTVDRTVLNTLNPYGIVNPAGTFRYDGEWNQDRSTTYYFPRLIAYVSDGGRGPAVIEASISSDSNARSSNFAYVYRLTQGA